MPRSRFLDGVVNVVIGTLSAQCRWRGAFYGTTRIRSHSKTGWKSRKGRCTDAQTLSHSNCSRRLVRVFDEPEEPGQHLKAALTKYYALLHYARIRHSVLLELLPLSTASALDVPPPHSVPSISLLVRPTLTLLKGLPLSLIQFVLFTPPLLLHLPGYITGPLTKRCFALPDEEEAAAQFKAIGGGLGIGANVALTLGVLWKRNKIGTLAALLGFTEDDDVIKKALGLVGGVYLGIVLLVRWHRLLIKGTRTHEIPFFLLLSHSPSANSQLPNVSTLHISPCPMPTAHSYVRAVCSGY